MAGLIDGAQHSLDIAMYSFRDGGYRSMGLSWDEISALKAALHDNTLLSTEMRCLVHGST